MNERLKQIRKSKKLSQRDFGDKINLSQNHISSLESGARTITPRIISDVCEVYNVNKDWFITGNGEMFKDELEQYNIADPEIKEMLRLFFKADEETREYIKGLMEKATK